MKYPRRRRRRALQQSLIYTRRREGRRRGKALHSSLPTKSFPPAPTPFSLAQWVLLRFVHANVLPILSKFLIKSKFQFSSIFFCYLTLLFSCFSFSSIYIQYFYFYIYLSLLLDFFPLFQQYFSPDFTHLFLLLDFLIFLFFFSSTVFKSIFHPDFSLLFYFVI